MWLFDMQIRQLRLVAVQFMSAALCKCTPQIMTLTGQEENDFTEQTDCNDMLIRSIRPHLCTDPNFPIPIVWSVDDTVLQTCPDT